MAAIALHYCRHCPEKMTSNRSRTAHAQWLDHYIKEHRNIALHIGGTGMGKCTKHCLGMPLADEQEKGMRLWGTHPDKPRTQPSPELLAKYREIAGEPDE